MKMKMVSLPGVDSFAKSPENAFSIVIATILVNALSSNIELNHFLLEFTLAFFLFYIFILTIYSITKAASLDASDRLRFNRHVFHAGLWIWISVPIIWSAFLPYPQPAYEQLPAMEWAFIIQIKNGPLMLAFAAPLVPLLLCKRLTRLKIRICDEFWKILREHAFEIVIGSIATLPFVITVSGLGIRVLLPNVWGSVLIFVIVWAALAAWTPRGDGFSYTGRRDQIRPVAHH